MFNDERINAECGKIYSRGILAAVLITLIYALSRTVTLYIQGNLHTVVTFTEALILLLGIAILGVGTFRFRRERDERTLYEQHMFYKKAAKAFLIAVFGTYILTIPFTTEEMLGGQPHNHLLILLEVIGYLYIFYSFKTKEININYSFIAEESSAYYRRVFLNIGALCLALFCPFLLAASWELILHESFAGMLTILFAYISSAIGLSAEYFFISLVEKTSYHSIDGCRFALGTRIVMLVCLAFAFTLSVLQCVYVHLVTGNLQATANVGTKIAFVSQQRLRVELLYMVLVGLAVCHIMSQIKKGTLLYTVCRLKMLFLVLSALQATLGPIWYRAFSDEALRFYAIELTPWLNFISFTITLTMWILFIHALTKELRMSRILWSIPLLRIISAILDIFFTSQSMIRTGNYVVHVIEMLCLILLTVIIWKYHGFILENRDS